ncbi:MAG: glycerophosphodiester phosphodiesterase family protein [Pirellulaceae bacterium]
MTPLALLPLMSRWLRSCWRSLLFTDLLFKSVAYVVLTPALGVVLRLFITGSGRALLADVEMVRFLTHPVGWTAVVVVLGAWWAVFAWEQSCIMAVVLSCHHQRTLPVVPALRFVARRALSVLGLTCRMVGWLLMAAGPFAVAAGTAYSLLLTEHDINYYLDDRPVAFWMAVAIGGVLVVALAAVWLWLVVSWSLALPLVLFEGVSPREALRISRERTEGARLSIGGWIAGWLAVTLGASTVLSVAVVGIARLTVPSGATSVWLLAAVVGANLLLGFVANTAGSVFANMVFGTMLAGIYESRADASAFRLPDATDQRPLAAIRMSIGRIASAVSLAVLLATLLGATALHQIPLEDHVEITAHRGGAAHAPENSLAAIRQAIRDGTDWVEVDVQETQDGVVVVAHDSDLLRMARVPSRIWEMTESDLRSVDIGVLSGPEFRGEHVPTLAEVLDYCRGKTRVNIELKYYGHNQQLEQRVVELVESRGMAADVAVMSLDADAVRKMQQLRPEWTTGLLIAVAAGDPTRAQADFLAVSHGMATRPFIRRAHAHGKRVHAWTVNDVATMSALISRGIDNLITDDPALARQVLEERAAMSPVERVLVEVAFLVGAGGTSLTQEP